MARFSEKLRFAFWGIRYFDILVLMAYPTMGAVFAVDRPDLDTAIRFAVFTVLNFLFVAHIYIFNDWSDAALNPAEPDRRKRHAMKESSLTPHEVLGVSAALGVVSLAGFAFLTWRLFAIGLFIQIVTALYSHPRINLKGKPVISTTIHFLGASLYFMGGWVVFKPFSYVEVCLGLFFGLILAAGHFSNEIEDFEQDHAAGIRTNAIAFGQRKVFMTGLFLFILSSLFLVYISVTQLGPNAYAWIAVTLVLVWLIQTWRYRKWKGGDRILGFRRFYRGLYALLCAALIAVRVYEWAGGAG